MMPPRAKTKKPPTSRQTITHQLRALIEASGLTPYEIGRRAGLESGIIRRFLKWERSLTLDSIDQLADALGFRLAETKRGRAKPATRPEAIVEERPVEETPGRVDKPPPRADSTGVDTTPDGLPQDLASEPPAIETGDPASAPSDGPPGGSRATDDPPAEPIGPLDETPEPTGPWWEDLSWESGGTSWA